MSVLSTAGLALMTFLVLASPSGVWASADTKPQTNREGGVTVKVTPRDLSR
jgi:hypothetical protein